MYKNPIIDKKKLSIDRKDIQNYPIDFQLPPVRDKLLEEMFNDDNLLNIFDSRKKSAPVFNWDTEMGTLEQSISDRRKPKPFDSLFDKYSYIKNKT